MTQNAVIFGTGSFAQVVDFYLTNDSDFRVVAFTATGEEGSRGELSGRPVVPFERVAALYPPDSHQMYVAVGYRRLNALREQFCTESRTKGYQLLSYVCSRASYWGDAQIGDNVFIFEENTIQPFVSIGNGSVLWSGNHVGHHSKIGNYCFITSHVVISGHCRIGDRCFLGVNSTIADDTSVADDNIIGPGALIQKNTAAGEVYIAERTKRFPKDSSKFFK